MNDRQIQMLKMRKQGMTFAEIGNQMGVSRQRVYQMIGHISEAHFRPLTKKDCVYVGIRNWMNNNKVCKTEFIRRIYNRAEAQTVVRYSRIFRGAECLKSTVDKILLVTGLTYEEAFRIEEENV